MNRIFKTSIMFATVALCAISCSKWTTQEPVDFKYTTLEEKNPALYQEYLEALRAYRESDHKVMIARVDNIANIPLGRAEHLNSLPDSVDYIVLNNASAVSETALSEAAELRKVKAQKTLLSIDYTKISKDYADYVEAFVAPEPEALPISEAEFVANAVNEFLAIYDKVNLDGILASYSGKNPVAMNADETEAVKAQQKAFFAPILAKVAGGDKLFFFEGIARNIITDENVLSAAKYIIVPVENKTTALAIDNAVLNTLSTDVPSDKFVAGVTALDLSDNQATNGLFSGESSAAVGAAYWAVTSSADFSKCGVCVNHAQYDYYHIGADYCEIRKAISVMNPSPIK